MTSPPQTRRISKVAMAWALKGGTLTHPARGLGPPSRENRSGKRGWGSCCGRLKGDMVTHSLEAADKALLGPPFGSFIEVVAAEIVVGLAGRQDVEGGDDDLVGDSAGGAARSAAHPDAMVFVAQVSVLGAPGGDRSGRQGGLEMGLPPAFAGAGSCARRR